MLLFPHNSVVLDSIVLCLESFYQLQESTNPLASARAPQILPRFARARQIDDSRVCRWVGRVFLTRSLVRELTPRGARGKDLSRLAIVRFMALVAPLKGLDFLK